MSDYLGRDGWHVGRPVREIGDEYVRNEFLGQARMMLGNLETMHLSATRTELEDNSPEKNFSSQGTWNSNEYNPSWYSSLFWKEENTYARKIPFKREKRRKTKIFREGNWSRKLVQSTYSRINRKRVTKALEEILAERDVKYTLSKRMTRAKVKEKIEGTKREKWVHTMKKSTYEYGYYVKMLRELITERLVWGYALENCPEHPNYEKPGDNLVRAYFGMPPFEEDRPELYQGEESNGEPSQEPSLQTQREPGEDLYEDYISTEPKTEELKDKKPEDEIPF